MPKPAQRRAISQYGQIRLTVTFEPSGRLHYRALSKRPQDAWSEHQVFSTGFDEYGSYPPTFDDALGRFALVAEGIRWIDLGSPF